MTTNKIIRDIRIRWGLNPENGKPLTPPEPPSNPSAEPPYFTCPSCGSRHFVRDTINTKDGVVTCKTVRCHGDSSGGKARCKWRGVWPIEADMGNPITETVSPETPAISAIAAAMRNGKTPCKPKKVGRREVVEREVVHDPLTLIVLSLRLAACVGRPDLRDSYHKLSVELGGKVSMDGMTDDPREIP